MPSTPQSAIAMPWTAAVVGSVSKTVLLARGSSEVPESKVPVIEVKKRTWTQHAPVRKPNLQRNRDDEESPHHFRRCVQCCSANQKPNRTTHQDKNKSEHFMCGRDHRKPPCLQIPACWHFTGIAGLSEDGSMQASPQATLQSSTDDPSNGQPSHRSGCRHVSGTFTTNPSAARNRAFLASALR